MRPSTLIFHCPACGSRLQFPASMQGVAGPCPKCKVTIRAPAICTAIPQKGAPGPVGSRSGKGPDGTPPRSSAGTGKEIPPLPSWKETEQSDPGGQVMVQPRGIDRLKRTGGPRIAPVRRIEPVDPKNQEKSEGARQGPPRRRKTSRRWLVAIGFSLAFLLSCAALAVFVVFFLRREDGELPGEGEAGLPRTSETGDVPEGASPGGVSVGGDEGKSTEGMAEPVVDGVWDEGEEALALPSETGE